MYLATRETAYLDKAKEKYAGCCKYLSADQSFSWDNKGWSLMRKFVRVWARVGWLANKLFFVVFQGLGSSF